MFPAGGCHEHHDLPEAVPGRRGHGVDRAGAGETRESGRGRHCGQQRNRGHNPRRGTRVRERGTQSDDYTMNVKEKQWNFFLNGAELPWNSVNSANSVNLINH